MESEEAPSSEEAAPVAKDGEESSSSESATKADTTPAPDPPISPASPPVRRSRHRRPYVRLRFLWVSLAATALLVGVGGAVWYLLAPTPTDRFQRFAEDAKRTLAERVADRSALDDSYRYDVVRTESTLSHFRGVIFFVYGTTLAEYKFDFRDDRWHCTEARLTSQESEGGPRKSKIIMGSSIAEYGDGKLMLTCSRY